MYVYVYVGVCTATVGSMDDGREGGRRWWCRVCGLKVRRARLFVREPV